MTDTIYINDLTLSCVIGAKEHERKDRQLVIINIAMSVDLTRASQSDDLNDTVNYGIYREIASMVEKSNYFLLEALAGAIADICLSEEKVAKVKVHIRKPGAVALGDSSAVEITRPS